MQVGKTIKMGPRGSRYTSYTPAYTEQQLDQMAADYAKLDGGGMTIKKFKDKYDLSDQQFFDFIDIVNKTHRGPRYQTPGSSNRFFVELQDYLVIGEGGVQTLQSDYGSYVLGKRLEAIQPHGAIGSVAGLTARIFTNNPNIIAAIESGGDLIETGLSGFVVARDNIEASTAPVIPQSPPISVLRVQGNSYRDQIADLLRQELAAQGLGSTVVAEATGNPIRKDTPFGPRFIDIEIRDAQGKPLGGIEVKDGNSRYKPSQRAKDEWLRLTEGYSVTVVRNYRQFAL
jgi:hypothetical protein